MRLIGAGLPRTATLSQKVAMEMLGLEPCYHMVSVFADLSEAPRWREALDGTLHPGEILTDCPATVDWPGSYYYKELIEHFPDAKVLLSVRDGDAWARSMRETIWECLYGDGLVGLMTAARQRIDPLWDGCTEMLKEMWTRSGLMNGEATTDEGMARAMERYNAEVQDVVPSDRLLVWTPTDGWEPICEFLELEIPDAPFPRIHDTKAFGQNVVDGALAAIQRHREAESAALAA
jgi:hypothetical protein